MPGTRVSMRKVFAGNLRNLSAREKSHAHVARELGLNRQQFDNYLKGKNLPNESVVARIIDYFQIDLSYMFSENRLDIGYNKLIESHRLTIDRYIDETLSNKAGDLKPGLYYVYFSIPGDRGSVACSLLAIRREGGLTTFKRVTRLRGASGSLRSMVKDIHSGIVIDRDGLVFFIGLDTTQGRYPSLLIAKPVTSREVIYSGESLISTGSEFEVVKFCISPTPKRTNIWKAMNLVSIVSVGELRNRSERIHQFFQY